VLVRQVDNDNFYSFETSSDGYYRFRKQENDRWSTLMSWTKSDAIYRGQATNVIRVECEGDTFTFFVNGVRLTSFSDSTFGAGDIGLFASTYDKGNVHISFDNLNVWAITDPPQPTSTPFPSPTPAMSVLPYSVDFSSPTSGWESYSDQDVTRAYEEGQYHITVVRDGLTVWEDPGKSFDDLVLEVEATQVEGPDDNQYGVLVRYVDSDNFYCFGISGDGYYRVEKLVNDEWVTLVNSSRSDAIRRGQATNVIRVEAEGNTFTFFVNGTRLASFTDGTFRLGDIGLFAAAYDEGNVHISFDNLSVEAIE
jgi:hypothetical protein